MSTTTIDGQLEIDHERGVIYFHAINAADVSIHGGITVLRICRLLGPNREPIPKGVCIDVTHMHGVSFTGHK